MEAGDANILEDTYFVSYTPHESIIKASFETISDLHIAGMSDEYGAIQYMTRMADSRYLTYTGDGMYIVDIDAQTA